jgi:hypothetical protein
VQISSVWGRACGLTRSVVEGVRFDETVDAIVVSVRPDARARGRCGRCGRRSSGYDQGAGRRRWRGLDAGTTRVFIEAEAARVRCRVHGPTVTQVPWARHDVGHTRDFDAMAAWLAVRTSQTATCQLLRVAWRTVGSIITRVNGDVEAVVDRLDGLRRIGIDEISYKRSQLIATSGALSFGFIGGPTFPLLFTGGAFGAVLYAAAPDVPEALAVTALMAAVASTVIPAPFSLAVLTLLIGGIGATEAPPVFVAALVAFIVGRLIEARMQRSDPTPPPGRHGPPAS